MGFFSKSKHGNDSFIINTDDESIKISGEQNLAPHAITANELSDLWNFGDEQPQISGNSGALDALKKRMNANMGTSSESKKADLSQENAEPTNKSSNISTNQKAENSQTSLDNHDKVIEKTLVEKVKRYTIDEYGHDASQTNEPLYQLESVAEILLNNSQNAIEKLSKKYDIFIEDFGKEPATKTSQPATPDTNITSADKTDSNISPTPTFEQMVNDSATRENQQIYEYLFPTKKQTEPKDISVPNISDIDTHEVGINSETSANANTATIRFTPIKDTKGNTNHIAISNITKHIDLGEEVFEDVYSKNTAQPLEESEFDKFTPKNEVTDHTAGKQIMRRYAIKKRSAFLSLVLSIISVIALSAFLIPPVFDFIIGNPKSAMITCGIFLLISVFANLSMFTDFKNLIKKRCGFDVLASLCTVCTLSLCVTAISTQQNAYYIILLCSVILLVRAYCRFRDISAFIGNLKQFLTKEQKKAVTLINDPATTFAMAKNAIDGDVLVASHKKTDFISDYIKHSDFALKLSGKTSLVFYFTLIFGLMSSIMAYFYYQDIYQAFYSITAISCIIAMPSLFFVNTLPLSSASKKLNSKGAMICGIHGAERIELSNAATISTNDIFPKGTIKMYSMKVLSDNNIDDTILRAASLTAAVNSPLEAIFNQIAGTNSSYSMPDSDTVKYEKNLGISGWVNNELLFIGNRSLMQAHNIAIPSLEVDKKILRQGYFPVYVATSDTACALIVIQYNVKPEIMKELRKVTELGLTLLIENCDPNITEQMICDYFGLYEDSVKIMSNAGVHMLKNATPYSESCSAPASYKGSDLNLIKIVNCASMIKKSNKLLTIMYGVSAILGVMYFIYAAFSGLTTIPSPLTVLGYELSITLLSIIGFLIRKP